MDNNRISFGSITPVIDIPDLLAIQKETFENFVQHNTAPDKRKNKGLQAVFTSNFPIFDNKENYRLDFIQYSIEQPRFTVVECMERGLTFSAPLKGKLRLSTKDPDTEEFVNTVEQEVYLGNVPFMTEKGTFVINGAERVVVSQLHRSPGVAFAQTVHPNGTPLYSARIIPLRGSWVEFATDINYVMYVYIDRRKKFPATTLLRALGYDTDDKILNLFNLAEEVDVTKGDLSEYVGRVVASDVFDLSTGEIFLSRESILSEEDIERLDEAEVAQVTEEDGEITFVIHKISNMCRIANAGEKESEDKKLVKIPIRKLDTFLADKKLDRLDFLRMDIEGSELKLFEGAKETIKKFKPMIQIELHLGHLGPDNTRKLLLYLQGEGYEFSTFMIGYLDTPLVGTKRDIKNYKINDLLKMIDENTHPNNILLFIENHNK
ncbi:MAG: FkbM family methyltransferase [Bacteroidetes bacterium]|nr:FkbM family methyltransferase [Bacteroidota bacterium]